MSHKLYINRYHPNRCKSLSIKPYQNLAVTNKSLRTLAISCIQEDLNLEKCLAKKGSLCGCCLGKIHFQNLEIERI